jgi:hypothetical protein
MKAMILGCSHAAGYGMRIAIPNDKQYIPVVEFELTHSYSALIADQLGYKIENYAVPGGSNDSMFRIFEENISTLLDTDIVIACWTGYHRTEIWDEQNKNWIHIISTLESSPEYVSYAKQWLLYHTDNRIGRLNKIKNIIALNTIAADKKIKVINIDSFFPVCNFNWPQNINWPISHNFYDWALENHYKPTPCGHFLLDAHEKFANLVVGNMKKESL